MSLVKIKPPTEIELRIFAILQVLFFVLIRWLIHFSALANSIFTGVLILAVIIGVVGLIRPQWVRWYHRSWMLLVLPIGWVVSHILMAIVYFGVVTPIGLWRRWRHDDPLQRQFDAQAESYWHDHRGKRTTESYFRQF